MKKILIALAVILSCFGSQGLDHYNGCATKDMTEIDRQGQKNALALAKLKKKKQWSGYQANSPKVIPVCFHIIGQPIVRKITRRRLKKDLDALNRAFSSSSCCDTSLEWCNGECSEPETNIKFVMAKRFMHHITGTVSSPTSLFACVDRTVVSWNMARPLQHLFVKRLKHVGDSRVLNIYFSQFGIRDREVLGFTFFPSITLELPRMDGVVINRQGRPGGRLEDYDEGDTLAHEVGHWLGLPHPFQGGCEIGDGIKDTPAQAMPLPGKCNPTENRDTCPDQPGLDGVHLFMSYQEDSCMYAWTQGQVDVMHANLEYYRSSKGVPSFETVELTLGEYSETFTLPVEGSRSFFVNVPASSSLYCKLDADDGDADFTVQWENSEEVDCTSALANSHEACIIGPGSGRVDILVYAYHTSLNVTVYCNIETRKSEIEIEAGSNKTSISLNEGDMQPYNLTFGDSTLLGSIGTLECNASASGNSADVDLLVSVDSVDGDSAQDPFRCVSSKQGSVEESCNVFAYKGLQVHVWLFSIDSTDVELKCDLVPPEGVVELNSGMDSALFDFSVAGEQHIFILQVPAKASVFCSLRGPSGNVNMFLNWNSPGDLFGQWECAATSEDSNEDCSLPANTGIVFVKAFAYKVGSDLTLTCTAE